MIRKKPVPHSDSGVDAGFPLSMTNAERGCAEIVLKQKPRSAMPIKLDPIAL